MFKNPYALLRDLLPDAPLQVGEVVDVENGVATIAVPGGGRVQARGEATVGDRVFFRDGAIEGAAPSLPLVIIEI
jgi:hypothetical protein